MKKCRKKYLWRSCVFNEVACHKTSNFAKNETPLQMYFEHFLMVSQYDGLYMLAKLKGKGLTELLLTRNFSPVYSEEFGDLYRLYYCIHYCSACKNVRV